MKRYLLPKEGEFFKANLHCHTTISDGKWSPEKVKEEYRLVYTIVSNAMKEFCGLFGEEVQEEELAYLTMHFATLFSKDCYFSPVIKNLLFK